MDINIITMNSDLSCNYDFGIYSWTKVIQSVPPGGTTVKLDNIEKYKRGTAVIFSNKVVTDNFSPVNDHYISDDIYVITDANPQTGVATLDRGIAFGLVGGSACLKIDKDSSQVKTVSGIRELFQTVQKFLLTSKGSDSFDLEYGSNLYSLLWKITPKDIEEAKSAIRVEMLSAERYIVKLQKKDPSVYPDERLTSIIVRNVSFDYNIQRWRIDLYILSEAGTSVRVQI